MLEKHITPTDTLLDELLTFISSDEKSSSSKSSPFRQLLKHGFNHDSVNAQLSKFKYLDNKDNDVLISYTKLHGVHLLNNAAPANEGYSFATKSIVAILQCVEVCLLYLEKMMCAMLDAFSHEDMCLAENLTRWVICFHETLTKLSMLAPKFNHCSVSASELSLKNSPAFQRYLKAKRALHSVMKFQQTENHMDIFKHDLDHHKRYVFFNEFVNTNQEAIWSNALNSVFIEVNKLDTESKEAFYARVLSLESVQNGVNYVDLKMPSFLGQFRAYHQLSELIVKHINDSCCEVMLMLMNNRHLDCCASILRSCCSLFDFVIDNLTPILRALSPKAYAEIRPALGITSGSHSVNIRQHLFKKIFPLLVKVTRRWLSGANEHDNEKIYLRAHQILTNKPYSPESEIIKQVVYFYQSIRLWRDKHMQFIKSQIGIGENHNAPSISGSKNAAQHAQKFRQDRSLDIILPLYKAVLGKSLPEALEIVSKDGFDKYMSTQTAKATKVTYQDIYARVAD